MDPSSQQRDGLRIVLRDRLLPGDSLWTADPSGLDPERSRFEPTVKFYSDALIRKNREARCLQAQVEALRSKIDELERRASGGVDGEQAWVPDLSAGAVDLSAVWWTLRPTARHGVDASAPPLQPRPVCTQADATADRLAVGRPEVVARARLRPWRRRVDALQQDMRLGTQQTPL